MSEFVNYSVFWAFVEKWCSELDSSFSDYIPDYKLPHCKMLTYHRGRWVAMDNSYGHCYVEDFRVLSNAKAYLKYEDLDLEILYDYDSKGKPVRLEEAQL